MLAPSIVEVIGRTPVIELEPPTRGLGGRIVAKLDYLNPGFSKKDRIAREDRRRGRPRWVSSGWARPSSSRPAGTLGPGRAIVCAIRGHPFVVVDVPWGNSREAMLHDAGARRRGGPGPPGRRNAVGAGDRRGCGAPGGSRAGRDTHAGSGTCSGPTSSSAARAGLAIERAPTPARSCGPRPRADRRLLRLRRYRRHLRRGRPPRLKALRSSIRLLRNVVEPEGAGGALPARPVTDVHHRIQGGGYANAGGSSSCATCPSTATCASATRARSLSPGGSRARRRFLPRLLVGSCSSLCGARAAGRAACRRHGRGRAGRTPA